MNRTLVVKSLLTLVIASLLLGVINVGVYAYDELVREHDEDDKYRSPDPAAERAQTIVVSLVVVFIIIMTIKYISDNK